MRILVIDDEVIICEGTVRLLQSITGPGDEVLGFSDPEDALQNIRAEACDVVFLDIEMPRLNGMDLARQIKILRPSCNIIFVTAFSHYQNEAWDMRASGYVLKPITKKRAREELEELRFPVPRGEGLYIRAFGSFEVFYQGEPLHFQYSKTREMLAYMIDRNGALISGQEFIRVLWSENEIRNSYYKRIRQDLIATLRGIGREDILAKQRGGLGLVRDRVDCDYFKWLEGTAAGINAFHGEYMTQYDWAEETRERLLRPDIK